MDQLKVELSNLISSLSEENFKQLIKSFSKEYYNAQDVRIIDGPFDGGIDLEIRKNRKVIKRNVQITVQKSKIEGKIRFDLAKARKNAKKFDYLKNLDFYYSQKISPIAKRTLK